MNSDTHVIQQVLAGRQAAFATIVDRYKHQLVGLAYNILLNHEDAEEVAYDTLMKAYKSLATFRADAKFSTWLYRILVNTALTRKKHQLTFEKMPADVLASQTETCLQGSEHQRLLDIALKRIPQNERLCITLFYLNELPVEEIKEATGLTVANIKVLLFRGRKSLHALLKDHLKEFTL